MTAGTSLMVSRVIGGLRALNAGGSGTVTLTATGNTIESPVGSCVFDSANVRSSGSLVVAAGGAANATNVTTYGTATVTVNDLSELKVGGALAVDTGTTVRIWQQHGDARVQRPGTAGDGGYVRHAAGQRHHVAGVAAGCHQRLPGAGAGGHQHADGDGERAANASLELALCGSRWRATGRWRQWRRQRGVGGMQGAGRDADSEEHDGGGNDAVQLAACHNTCTLPGATAEAP